jgi:hypothetical protein
MLTPPPPRQVLFELLNTLFQHNIHAMVHDVLCFYSVNAREVDAELLEAAGAPLRLLFPVPPPPVVLDSLIFTLCL